MKLKSIFLFIVLLCLLPQCSTNNANSTSQSINKLNIILCMTDDQGWGDVGYNDHPVLQTPHLDQMAQEGIRFNRFYSASAVCSPTRGSCLTGRHPHRYGIVKANKGHIKEEEITLAEFLKKRGYRTGHFGKWHLGTLTTKVKDSNRGAPGNIKDYSPPWQNGFDVCFSTEAKVPTWNPIVDAETGKHYGTYFWNEKGQKVTDNLQGDASRVVMDRALPFIEDCVKNKKSFFTVIWFHTPHKPVVAGPKYLAMYPKEKEKWQHFYGCLTAMDEQMGRLRASLKKWGADQDTMIWFNSDNGPEGRSEETAPGKTGGLRGRKRSLYEGGVRVPGLLVWPRRYAQAQVIDTAVVTSDFFPTILAALGHKLPAPRPYDGENLLPLLDGQVKQRLTQIGFAYNRNCSLIDNDYKLFYNGVDKRYELYNIAKDKKESINLSKKEPERLARMKKSLDEFMKSCKNSNAGNDY